MNIKLIKPILYIALGSGMTVVPYLIFTGILPFSTFATFALGMGAGILLLFLVFLSLWDPT